uniref:HIVEP zinc finger 3b n=1 Tax=Oryzias latipes TaxID=8090 RepID=A0A3P9K1B8_ORYLA
MEAEPSRRPDRECSERQEQQHETAESSLESCPPQQPRQPPGYRPVPRGLGRSQNRQSRRSDLLRLQQRQAAEWQHSDSLVALGSSFLSTASPAVSSLSSTSSTQDEHLYEVPSHSSQEGLESICSPRKGEKKPQKPGKYVCTYCGRPCAKPSVLQKHIRSHTGERPYPCVPCGFSFKTKSNLYKHRKSHAHRIKADLASCRDEPSLSGPEGSGVGEDPEEHTDGESTESEEETAQHRKLTSKEMLRQLRRSDKEYHRGLEESQRPEDSQAVKQRLALRLSERKRPGSKGSTESGYYSGSGSTELSQVSPPSSSAKTYAEIILGKYGRIGGQQRSPHQQQPHCSHPLSSGAEEKSISFAVPKTQVIEHITKLITINEAVVDTSEIDSVKPRRSSLSRKSSMESPKFIVQRDPYTFDPKEEVVGPSSMRHPQNPEVDPLDTPDSSAVPFFRSHSMPSPTSQAMPFTSGTASPRGHRLCQSFDEQQVVVAEMRGTQRMLKRQPAIEVPIEAELMLEEASSTSMSSTSRDTESVKQPQQQHQEKKTPCGFECEACGAYFQSTEAVEPHRSICPGKEQEGEDASKTCKEEWPLMMHNKFRALAIAVRKRRKEESLEDDPPSPVPVSGSTTGIASMPSRSEHRQANSGLFIFSCVTLQSKPETQQQQERKGVSVIQHTSSFEKQESISMESQEPDLRENKQTQRPEPKPTPSTSRLIRQPNIQVPEILVTVELDPDIPSESEKSEEFHWPQRSHTLAQLPAEKLPPKKKRLRLAEAAQSSGGSSFGSLSMPRSPSQKSNISSHSASFEDTVQSEPSVWASGNQNSQMLMVPPASHQQSHKEMRRSASEQAPASPQQTKEISETRSKSFDFGSLSLQQSTSSWKERQKCLLKNPVPDERGQTVTNIVQLSRAESPKSGLSHSPHPSVCSTEVSSELRLEGTGKALQLPSPQIFLDSQDLPILQHRGHFALPPVSPSQLLPVTTAPSENLSSQVIHRAFLHTQTAVSPIRIHSPQIHVLDNMRIPLHQVPPLVPMPFPSRNRALYFSVTPRLGANVHSLSSTETRPSISSISATQTQQSVVTFSYHHPQPVIATCLAQLAPVVSLVVPVRLQVHIPTFASAMYTTISQMLASTQSQEPVSCTAMVIMGQVSRDKLQRDYLKIPSQDIKNLLSSSLPTEMASSFGEGCCELGAGGSKRMLSPAASLELSTEAQHHQKRVKEEEEQCQGDNVELEERQEEKVKASTEELEDEERKPIERVKDALVKTEGMQDQLPRKYRRDEKKGENKRDEKTSPNKEEVPILEPGFESIPSHPSLHTSTSVNWCYLKYVKPNPCTQRDPSTSVYSTWSISAHNPNLPGLSTKVALSLLCSKQKHCSETYTMATATTAAKLQLSPASQKTSLSVSETQQKHKKEESKTSKEEKTASFSKQSGSSSQVHIFEGGYKSNEEYIYVRGRGRGRYICGECGIRCKKPSMLKKHIRSHTDVRPYICQHCNFAFKTKGNLTKHMKSKAHGKKCQAMGLSESSLDEPESEETGTGTLGNGDASDLFCSHTGSEGHACGSEEQGEQQFSDVEESDYEEVEEQEEESASHEDLLSSCSSDTHPSSGGHSSSSRHSQRGTPDPEPSPSLDLEPPPRGVWPSRRATSPGSRRVLFSQRNWKVYTRAFSPSSESCSPSHSLSPRLDFPSPIRSLSPRGELSTPMRHISSSPERGPSPIRPLSPLRPVSPSCYKPSQVPTPPSLRLQHRTTGLLPWESPSTKGGYAKMVSSAEETSLFSSAFQLSTGEAYPSLQTADTTFSHLPMHSQQAKVNYLMIPIGGIQMVQARPRSHPTISSSPTSPPLQEHSMAHLEPYWGRTPRTQGLSTPADHWSGHQIGTSQPVQHDFTTAEASSKPDLQRPNLKQYASLQSSVQTQSSSTETSQGCATDSPSRAPRLSLAVPVALCAIRKKPEKKELPSFADGIEGGPEEHSDGKDQST